MVPFDITNMAVDDPDHLTLLLILKMVDQEIGERRLQIGYI